MMGRSNYTHTYIYIALHMQKYIAVIKTKCFLQIKNLIRKHIQYTLHNKTYIDSPSPLFIIFYNQIKYFLVYNSSNQRQYKPYTLAKSCWSPS